MGVIRVLGTLAALVGLVAAPAAADTIEFTLLANQSRATFKTDAPLETIVGNGSGEAITGALALDPARPAGARGMVRVDMTRVKTGIDKRDADMLGKTYLDVAANPENRFVAFQVTGVEAGGPLEPGRDTPVKIRGRLTVKQTPLDVVADGQVVWIKLTPEQVEAQKRFGFTADNVKVRARFATLFTNHAMQVPQLLFLKVSNEIQLETDLTFVRR
jgi:polyisoprenoid-binding protein YceI